ncbi:MAG: PAS domain-containing protein [Acidobacteria bacterium]|nr:PAS domain-containing protein [Acidobacteriota bacterium]
MREATTVQQAVLDFAGYAIFSTKPDGTIETFNPAVERMLGYTVGEVINHSISSIIHNPEELDLKAKEFSEELGVNLEPRI